MFTGIVTGMGSVRSVQPTGAGREMCVVIALGKGCLTALGIGVPVLWSKRARYGALPDRPALINGWNARRPKPTASQPLAPR